MVNRISRIMRASKRLDRKPQTKRKDNRNSDFDRVLNRVLDN